MPGVFHLHRPRHKGIKRAHAHAAQQAQCDALRGHLSAARLPAISQGVNHDGQHHQRDAAKKQQRIALGRDDVVQHGPDHEREPDSDRKRHGQPGDGDGGDQEQVGEVENGPAHEGVHEIRGAGAPQVLEETVGARGVAAAERHADQDGAKHDAPDVVPIEKLEAPVPGELLRVRPAPPADHAEEHHRERRRINLWNEHGAPSVRRAYRVPHPLRLIAVADVISRRKYCGPQERRESLHGPRRFRRATRALFLAAPGA